MSLSDYSGKKILITGGLGFIGSNLAVRLVGLGAEVTLVDSMVPEYGGNWFNIEPIKSYVQVNISDIRDPYSMRYLISGKDVVFNLAGQTSHMDSMSDPFTDLEINCVAQLSILEAIKKYNPNAKIIYTSTRQIYGKPSYLPVDEKHILHPVDVNGVNKMAGERYHILYHEVYGMKTSALRLTNTIGTRMRIKDARQTFLGVWIRMLLEGKPFEVWGGEQLRDFSDIEDVVDALLLCGLSLTAEGKIYNIGGDTRISLKDLADKLVSTFGVGTYRVNEYPSERKKIDIGDYYADYSLILSELAWRPKVSLDKSLEKIVAYYQENASKYLV